ncbi:IS3 family transposase [Weissella paramesenteroides]
MDKYIKILFGIKDTRIEFYNNRRIRTKLKGKSPVKYRELANQPIA